MPKGHTDYCIFFKLRPSFVFGAVTYGGTKHVGNNILHLNSPCSFSWYKNFNINILVYMTHLQQSTYTNV